MKRKKILALFLTSLMLLSTVGLFTANAEDTLTYDQYADLMDKKREYIEEQPDGGIFGDDFVSDLTVLFYTDIAKEWTYERVFVCVVNDSIDNYDKLAQAFHGYGFYIKCDELEEARETFRHKYKYSFFWLREFIKYFDISKEELIAANKKMQEEPDSILSLFPMLSESDIGYARRENGLFCKYALPDFLIDILYLEDDRASNTLYVGQRYSYKNFDRYLCLENGFIVSAGELANTDSNYSHECMTVEELAKHDLKPVWVEYFLNNPEVAEILGEEKLAYLKAEREYQLANPDVIRNGLGFNFPTYYFYSSTFHLGLSYELLSPKFEIFLNDPRVIAKFGEEDIAYLKAQREKYLKNPSTGEALYLIPVALVSLTLGALVIYPRRRKIDNI